MQIFCVCNGTGQPLAQSSRPEWAICWPVLPAFKRRSSFYAQITLRWLSALLPVLHLRHEAGPKAQCNNRSSVDRRVRLYTSGCRPLGQSRRQTWHDARQRVPPRYVRRRRIPASSRQRARSTLLSDCSAVLLVRRSILLNYIHLHVYKLSYLYRLALYYRTYLARNSAGSSGICQKS